MISRNETMEQFYSAVLSEEVYAKTLTQAPTLIEEGNPNFVRKHAKRVQRASQMFCSIKVLVLP